MATNLVSQDKLNEHLLPGLSTLGVPSGLVNTAIPFTYNDIENFEKTVNANQDAGVICLEGLGMTFHLKIFWKRLQC